MKKIVVIGSTDMDMTAVGKTIPVPGETVLGIKKFLMCPGGKGANQAVAVARLAGKKGACTFIGKVGDDRFGRETAPRMRKEGMNVKLVVDKENPTGTALIFVDAKGQNAILVTLGANGTLSAEDLAPFEKEITSAGILLMQLETPVPTVLAAAEKAHAAGVTVILNPAPAQKLPAALFKSIDWATPNETEAEILTGVKVVDEKTASAAAAKLLKRGVKHVIITLGSHGCYSSDLGRILPAQKVKAIDTVAAGDTFNGAFAVALAEGKSIEEAIDFAQKASAIAVSRPGAQPSVPMRSEVK
ncbi:MAG: ribokinase [Kiritimatiellae bacterium]|nr:ribokinase [Kiritimatiellia bacterium]